MATIFILLYQYFNQRKTLLFGLVASIFVVASIFIYSNIELNEDVSKIIPLDKAIKKVNTAYQNSKFSDKLIFHLSPKDSLSLESPEALINFADSLVYRLEQNFDSTQIKEIRYTIAENSITQLFDLFYNNLPLFLQEKDYQELAQRLDSSGVQKTLRNAYKTLISPTGFFMKKNILRDPMNLATLPLQSLQDFQIEGNYTLYNNRIMTTDKKHLLFFVSPTNSASSASKNKILLEKIDSQIHKNNALFNDQFQAEYFGSIAVTVANTQQIKADISYTVIAAMIVLFIFIILFFKRLSTPFLIFVPVLLGASIGMASLIFIKTEISAISLGVGAVLLGITVDFSLHIFTHYRRENDIKKTIKDISTPMLMSSLTTSSAFLCLLYMSSEALQDLGIFAAISVFCSAIFALLILPHFLPKSKPSKAFKTSLLDRLAAYPIHQKKGWIISVFSLTILFSFFYNKVSFEEDMNNINFMTPSLKIADKNLQKMSGQSLTSTFVVSTASSLNQALEYNEKATKILEKLQTKGVLQNYTSVSKFLFSKKAQKEKIARWNQFWTPQKKAQIKAALIAQGKSLKFKENSFDKFYQLLDKEFEPVNLKEFESLKNLILKEYISEKNGQVSLISIVKLAPENKAEVYAAFKDLTQSTIFDKKFIAEQFAKSLKKDFASLVNWSFLIVFLILLVAFGRLELALLTMFPIVLSWEWTLGVMGLLGLKFNIVNIIICTFIFGLGIDYSIFITKGLLHQYKYGEKILTSYKTSIILSALTTICGMGVMIFAQHPALFSIASLSVIGLLSILIITFTIQPILFGFLIVNRNKKGLPPYTFLNAIATIIAYTFFVSGSLFLTFFAFVLGLFPFAKYQKKYFLHRATQILCKALIVVMFNVKKNYYNQPKNFLEKPALIIANHQSFLDIILILMLHPKIIILTNNWVWNSPIFGRLIQFLDFYPTDEGAEKSAKHLAKMVEKGYSVMIFPEGTRSLTGKIGRFKKGAFYLAEKLNIDILPIVFHATGRCIRKNDFLVYGAEVSIKFLDRIPANNYSFGEQYSERCKSIGQYFKKEYQQLAQQVETSQFYQDILIKNYLYKSPVLEWYTRIKIRLENGYQPFDKLLPERGKITDIGCGYGLMPYMMQLLSDQRKILALDYDKEKIKVAKECFLNYQSSNIEFVVADATTYLLPDSDAFIISDMLHYIPAEAQYKLIKNCLDKLSKGGVLIIREGDKDLKKRHKGTVWTEKFSTQIFSFNKTKEQNLSFISGKKIAAIAQEYGLKVERLDLTQKTSNIIFVIRK